MLQSLVPVDEENAWFYIMFMYTLLPNSISINKIQYKRSMEGLYLHSRSLMIACGSYILAAGVLTLDIRIAL